MKSYLRFLSRNKLYTAIEVVGLSIALAFVIVLSSYIVNDMSINKVLKKTDDIYLCHCVESANIFTEVPALYEIMPEIESTCRFIQTRNKSLFDNLTKATANGHSTEVSIMGVSDTFFDFFTFPLSQGNSENAFATKNSVIISEHLAATLFPNENVLGKEINVFEQNRWSHVYPDFADFNVNLIITGVFKPFGRTIFYEPDMIMRYDLIDEQQYSMFHGGMRLGEFSFIKLAKGTDKKALVESLTLELRKTTNKYSADQKLEIDITPFDDIKKQNPEVYAYAFTNIRQGKLFNIYLIICILLTIVSLLDYIVLTIAFSRFRIKEIATRQLLGTDRKGVIGRCFTEALILLAISCLLAIIIAVTFKYPISQILGAEINPLSQLNEYIILAGVTIIMVAIASSVPSLILSSYNAINIIKGEAKYHDRTTYGKVFIGLAGFFSIATLSICFAISRQTRHLINQEFGYNIDEIICIEFLDDNMNRFFDELQASSFIDKTGLYSSLPVMWTRTFLLDNSGETEDIYTIDGTQEYLEILDIQILEDYNIAYSDPSWGRFYICRSSLPKLSQYMHDGNLQLYEPQPLNGVVSDFKIGMIKDDSTGNITFANIHTPEEILMYGGNIIVKVNINEQNAKMQIKEFYRTMGYKDHMLNIFTLREAVEHDMKEDKNMLKLLSGFSLICLLMTIMIVVGLSSYHAKTNERNNAVRNVFGCSKGELVRKMTFDFVLPVLISAVVAIPIAYTVIGRWLEGYVIRTDNSPAIYARAFAVVLVIVIAAILLQANRMIKTNPAEALKKE